jgi:hypothetical protein
MDSMYVFYRSRLFSRLTPHSMLGSLSVYRRVLNDNFFNPRTSARTEQGKLPVMGHALAGTMAGWTVSFIAAPVEHIKARLQIQYAADKRQRSIEVMVSPAFTTVSARHFSFGHSSASGGARTTSSRDNYKSTQTCQRRQ